MDKLIYTAMTGAKATMGQQASVAHNLANASTVGFRAELHRLRAVQVQSEAQPTRAFVVDASVGSDFSSGPLNHTARPLDAAVNGQGWFTVLQPDGSEAYTRAGSFKIDDNGVLRTQGGLEVAGDGGQLAIPPENAVEIGPDGTITAVPLSGTLAATNTVGRLKLVNPPEEELVRGDDGLFRLKSGQPANQDENVRVSGGYLEGSNVNPVDQMVNMISLARSYETQLKLISSAQDNDKSANQVIAAR
ncbi:flagellar basal-body rod protein FlgF [Uliginosibacterium aquaticum]|uniref:Flagellar basal-body rod protein FlgF n=1 Tax=Uliginosibacterium aquaticum TaxID=2731212 RepID=A0ABX2IFN9_9RHOO|nr:flagellar basal-body rod protein FlgF [Uliginosibacterium aquaticum]NSL55535.1 flagellar basal-body rod protein FlgF [Uliginosibacterium aquaticum]